MTNPGYHERFQRAEGAACYAGKHSRGIRRRLSSARELRCVARALDRVGACGVILDIPCGAGRAQPLLAPRASRLIAADRSAAMLEIVRARSDGVAPALLAGDAFDLGLRDRSVDGIVTIRLLHHFRESEDRRRILAELSRVARRFVVATFLDADCLKQRLHLARRRIWRRPVRRALVSRSRMAAEMRDLGFETRGFFPLSGLFSGQTTIACVRKTGG